jgi:hypothetical protein
MDSLLESRTKAPAGIAPRGPEVDHDEDLLGSLKNLSFKRVITDVN